MEEGTGRGFKYSDTAKELWESIEAAYAQKRNNSHILELKKEIATFTQGNLSTGDYYSKFRALWRELELYLRPEPCCAKKQAKLVEDLLVFELLGGVNQEYETVCARFTSQDPLPPIVTGFALLQSKESQRKKRTIKDATASNRSALTSNSATTQNQSTNTRVGGGRGCGRGGNRGGCTGGGRGGRGGIDRDRLFCTHCGKNRHTSETCWNLVGTNQNTSATPAKSDKNGDQEKATTKVDSENWQNELAILRQRLAALEG